MSPKRFKALVETNPDYSVNNFNNTVLNKFYSYMIRTKKHPTEITHKDIEELILNDDKIKGRMKIRAYKKIIDMYEYIINNKKLKKSELYELSKVYEDLKKHDIKDKVLKRVEYLTHDDIKKLIIKAYESSDLPAMYAIVLSLYWGVPVTRFFGERFELKYDVKNRMIIKDFKNRVYIYPWHETLDPIVNNFINLSKNLLNNGIKHINRFYQSKMRNLFEHELGYYFRSDVIMNTFYKNIKREVPEWILKTYKNGIKKSSKYYSWGLEVIANEYVNSLFGNDNYIIQILKELKIIGG